MFLTSKFGVFADFHGTANRVDRGFLKGHISRTVGSKEYVLGPKKTNVKYFEI
jgi:hypothetical protein